MQTMQGKKLLLSPPNPAFPTAGNFESKSRSILLHRKKVILRRYFQKVKAEIRGNHILRAKVWYPDNTSQLVYALYLSLQEKTDRTTYGMTFIDLYCCKLKKCLD